MPAPTKGRPIEQVEFAREQRHNPSKAEAMLWQALRNRQLGVRFRRQHPCDRFVLDFYCVPAQLAIEVDGPLHDKQAQYDRWRDEQLKRTGVHVMRFSIEAISSNVVVVVDQIEEALKGLLGG